MAQHPKKSSHGHNASNAAHSAAKLASTTASKATSAALSAAESARSSAETFAKFGTDSLKGFFANNAEEAQKAHEKAFAFGRESAGNFSRAADALTRTLNDLITVSRENTESAVEVSQITADIAKSFSAELTEIANTNFTENVELCQEAFSCRNINDVLELQNKWLANTLDNFFSQSTRLTELCFELATEASEPINERVVEATERFSKSLAA